MHKLLEILGRAITVETADLIWHWLNAVAKNIEDKNKAEQVEEVLELIGNRELKEALDKLKFYLFENPDCVYGRMAGASISLHEQNLDEAVENLQSVYMRQPSNTMALYAMGYCYERLGKSVEAVEFYQDCLKFKSHLQLPRQRIAAIYFKSGKIDKATNEYELLTTEHPDDISSTVLLGYLYVADKQYDKALDTFNTAILAHPDNFHDEDHDDELEKWIEAGEFDHAVEHIQTMIDDLGDLPDLNVRMADTLSKADRPADAISFYENAIRLQPNYLEATIKLGTHYLRFGRQSLAAEQFNRAIEINDEIVDAYIGLAIAQFLSNQEDESYRTLSLASAIQQNSILLFSQTAMLHMETQLNDNSRGDDTNVGVQNQKPKALIDDVIKAHQIQMSSTPKSPDIHYKFGLLMMAVNNIEEAIGAFERSLEINPTNYRVKSKLALCLYEAGQQNAAMEKLVSMEMLDVDTLNLHYQTATLYCNKQKFVEALCNLENTMKENFTEPDALINIEVVLENLGLVDRANATWDRLAETAKNAAGTKFEE
jgi:tetratricopeptide (TPR) repeat protein